MKVKLRSALLLAASALAALLAAPAAQATITVANPNDSGPGSLREAIHDAASTVARCA